MSRDTIIAQLIGEDVPGSRVRIKIARKGVPLITDDAVFEVSNRGVFEVSLRSVTEVSRAQGGAAHHR